MWHGIVKDVMEIVSTMLNKNALGIKKCDANHSEMNLAKAREEIGAALLENSCK